MPLVGLCGVWDDGRMACVSASAAGTGGVSRWPVVVLCLVLLASACRGSDSGPSLVTSTPNTVSTTSTTDRRGWDWPVSTPEEQGMDSSVLAELIDEVVASGGIDSVTVVRNGYLVLDTVVYPFPEDSGHNVYSVSKSVTATLIGVAIDQGLLAGVDLPVVEVLAGSAPAVMDELKASMTVEDLLAMSSGLECRDSARYDWQGIYEMMANDDWAAHVLALPMVEEPGTHFEYCNGATYLLSAIVTEVTGQPASEFAAEVLFEPLGITDYTWPTNPEGITMGFSDLVLEPSDLAKIGYLYLRDGEWDGNQVVSQSWIEAATTPHAPTNSFLPGDEYGYQWWVDDADWVSARGHGGQFIFVIPVLDLVMSFTSALPPRQTYWPHLLVRDYGLRATKPGPLPPNPDGTDRLAAAVAAARSGPEPSPVDLPEMSSRISGVRYDSQINEYGHEWFTITFDQQAAHLAFQGAFAVVFEREYSGALLALRGIEGADEPIEVEIGLNGRYTYDSVWGLPSAWQGQWTGDKVFVVEFQTFGRQILRGSFEITFEDDTAHVVLREETRPQVETSTAVQSG